MRMRTTLYSILYRLYTLGFSLLSFFFHSSLFTLLLFFLYFLLFFFTAVNYSVCF